MSTTNSPTSKPVGTDDRTGIRPTYFSLGIDAEGAHHCYRTLDETIFVIDEAHIVHREDVSTRSVDAWMRYIAEKRGWQRKDYGLGIAGLIQRAFGGE